MTQAEETKIRELSQILENDSEITLAILFGSFATGTVHPNSDIDLAVQTRHPLEENKKIQMIETTALIFGRPVDLIDLRKVGIPLLGQIIKYGKVLKDTGQHFTELAIKNVYTNEDFLPYIKRNLKMRREKWIKSF